MPPAGTDRQLKPGRQVLIAPAGVHQHPTLHYLRRYLAIVVRTSPADGDREIFCGNVR